MTRKEYNEYLKYELYRNLKNPNILQKIKIKYFRPETNCVYLSRKMWYFWSKGWKTFALLIHLKIMRKYGCLIFPHANIGRGFCIGHPVGIVIGGCTIGENFRIYQNCTIGVRENNDTPVIGDNCILCTSAIILGEIKITDNVIIGAGAIVLHDIEEPGTYVGVPAKKLQKSKTIG